MAYHVEVTDTFGNDANYSWVHRYTIDESEVKDIPYGPALQKALVRKAKALAGWTGWRTDNETYGYDNITLRPRGMCQIMFITWKENEDNVLIED